MSDPRTEAGRALYGRLLSSRSDDRMGPGDLERAIIAIEAEAAGDATELRAALERLAPHRLSDGTRCYCSIFGKWWGYEYGREHDADCAAARSALASLPLAPHVPAADCARCARPIDARPDYCDECLFEIEQAVR